MKPARRRRRWTRLALAGLLLGAYPAFVLAATYVHWFAADLPGGNDGPGDAYRHALASAIVAYTTSPRLVDWTTLVMERGGRGSRSRKMDAHNNRVGARIGAQAGSWGQMPAAVLDAVKSGAVDARNDNQITWLPPRRWRNSWH